jgi:photosynthetic reaction center H subunit
MLGLTFFGDTDLAAVAIWGFWIFFAGLIFYIQRENMREGYPLEDDLGRAPRKAGLFGLPRDKTFRLPFGRGELTVPSGQRLDRSELPLRRGADWAGAPYIPVGDPMVGGVGPAAWANRRDEPELDGHGHPKLRPMSALPDFRISAGRDPRGLPVVGGDNLVVGRIVDVWIDVPEQLIRYLTVELNIHGEDRRRLLPFYMLRVKSDRVVVRSLGAEHFPGIPGIASPNQVTLLEEEKIMAWVAGGTLYANPSRVESIL